MDKTTAMVAAQAVLAALYAKSRGRGGQEISLNMLDAGLYFNWCDIFAEAVFDDKNGDDYEKKAGIVPEMVS